MAEPTWTPQDEATFEAMRKRREEVVGAREKELQNAAASAWAQTVNLGPDTLQQADRVRCVEALTYTMKANAYAMRKALEPFDLGPPPAVAEAPARKAPV